MVEAGPVRDVDDEQSASPVDWIRPADLFFGRPSWIPDMIPDPDQSPVTENWIVHQIKLQEKATKILQESREKHLKRAKRGHTEAHYREEEYVLIRFPQ